MEQNMTTLHRSKKPTTGRIIRDTLFSFRHKRGNKCYAVVTAKWDDLARDPLVIMAGPFDTEEGAQEFYGKRLEAASRGGKLDLPDIAGVPQDVRQEITGDIFRSWRSGQLDHLRSWGGGEDIPLDLKPKH